MGGGLTDSLLMLGAVLSLYVEFRPVVCSSTAHKACEKERGVMRTTGPYRVDKESTHDPKVPIRGVEPRASANP
ncbi:hypothetical protein B0H15DRAFT_867474 [Mycena belliarum]|uniref:Secreted protein n=1 Tax=Mycena belliarum TaxID=1033014 RepID=A0AAD6TQW8_9AGAR|nr:hypothetical protein B0H15DRAFT_867474 [Mycena belliae]